MKVLVLLLIILVVLLPCFIDTGCATEELLLLSQHYFLGGTVAYNVSNGIHLTMFDIDGELLATGILFQGCR